jgi:hypothetical protein
MKKASPPSILRILRMPKTIGQTPVRDSDNRRYLKPADRNIIQITRAR